MLRIVPMLSAAFFLLLASTSVMGVAGLPDVADMPRGGWMSIRQSTDDDPVIAPECATQCNKLDDDISNAADFASTCTNDIMSLFESCFDCEANAGEATVAQLQDAVNTFVQSCADIDKKVKDVTVVAKKTNGGERMSRGIFWPVAASLAALALAVL
ncbi:hypothetical protein FB451DRAFT_1562234 [Mycena latifolia]|nr:hypothetical protein FB451DRAFT_1562234 [Mycena latifolia]